MCLLTFLDALTLSGTTTQDAQPLITPPPVIQDPLEVPDDEAEDRKAEQERKKREEDRKFVSIFKVIFFINNYSHDNVFLLK